MSNHSKTNEPTVDIIIPVYNVEPYLRRCLDSILGQTYNDWRAICVDDGSTDNSSSILETYASQDSRFKIIRKQNGGLSDARNWGIAASKADYLMFVDSDDFIHPQTLEIAVGLALRDGSDIVSWYRDLWYQNIQLKLCRWLHLNPISARPWRMCKRYRLSSIRSFVTDDILAHCNEWRGASGKNVIKHCYVWRHLLKREAVTDVPFKKGIYFEDIPWWSEVILKPLRATITNLPLYYYYNNPKSISRDINAARKAEAIFTNLMTTYMLYKSKATERQMNLWSHNIKWAILNNTAKKVRRILLHSESEHLRKVISEMIEMGVTDDAHTEIEKKTRQQFLEAGNQQITPKT